MMVAPSVALLLIWMIVPLAMTLYYSFQNYNLPEPRPRRASPGVQLPVFL
jgi:ABC-type sugar transport system permease subunit